MVLKLNQPTLMYMMEGIAIIPPCIDFCVSNRIRSNKYSLVVLALVLLAVLEYLSFALRDERIWCPSSLQALAVFAFTTKSLVAMGYVVRIRLALTCTPRVLRVPSEYIIYGFAALVLVVFIFNNVVAWAIMESWWDAESNKCVWDTKDWTAADELSYGIVDFVTLVALAAFYLTRGRESSNSSVFRRILMHSLLKWVITAFSAYGGLAYPHLALETSILDRTTDIVTFVHLLTKIKYANRQPLLPRGGRMAGLGFGPQKVISPGFKTDQCNYFLSDISGQTGAGQAWGYGRCRLPETI